MQLQRDRRRRRLEFLRLKTTASIELVITVEARASIMRRAGKTPFLALSLKLELFCRRGRLQLAWAIRVTAHPERRHATDVLP